MPRSSLLCRARRTSLPLFGLTALALPAQAQRIIPGSQSTVPAQPSLAQMLVDSTAAAMRGRFPNDSTTNDQCPDPIEVPDSLVLVYSSFGTEDLWGWREWGGDPSWTMLVLPVARPDTLRFRLVTIRCPLGWYRPSLYLEHAGVVVGYQSEALPRVAPGNPARLDLYERGAARDTTHFPLRLVRPDGSLPPTVLEQPCEHCAWRFVPYFPLLDSLDRARVRADSLADAAQTRADSIDGAETAVWAAKARAARARAEAARQREVRTKGWSPRITQLVLDRQVAVGMTPAQVHYAWGSPDHVRRTTGTRVREEWTYDVGSVVVFVDGCVTTFSTVR